MVPYLDEETLKGTRFAMVSVHLMLNCSFAPDGTLLSKRERVVASRKLRHTLAYAWTCRRHSCLAVAGQGECVLGAVITGMMGGNRRGYVRPDAIRPSCELELPFTIGHVS